MNREDIFSSPCPCTVIFDTCSILKGDDFAAFTKQLLSLKNHKIVILNSVIEELRYLALSKTSVDCRVEALNAYTSVQVLLRVGVIRTEGEQHEQADFSILKYVSVNRFTSQRLVIITQDRQLSADILRLNNITSISMAPTVTVFKLGKGGVPIQFLDDCQKNKRNNADDIDISKRLGIA